MREAAGREELEDLDTAYGGGAEECALLVLFMRTGCELVDVNGGPIA